MRREPKRNGPGTDSKTTLTIYMVSMVIDIASSSLPASVEPGHGGWVVGSESAVVIEFDFEGETAARFGMPDEHRHGSRT